MNIRSVMVTLLLLATIGVQAQKIDHRLTQVVEQSVLRRAQGHSAERPAISERIGVDCDQQGFVRTLSVQAYLKSGAHCPTQQLEAHGIRVRYVVDDVAVLSVPADKLGVLEQISEIAYAKADPLMHRDNDQQRKITHAADLMTAEAATAAGLPKSYTGSGVVVGVIDGGIDFNHAALRNADGTTRIKKLVVFQNNTGTAKEYNTDAEIKTLTTDEESTSHGTHTISTAVGTNLGNGLQGVAPEADLVVIAMGNTTSESNMADGMRRIAAYAESVGKPFVISMSMGILNELHDGSTLVCKTAHSITDGGTKQGRAVVLSAGNSGDSQASVVKTLGAADADGWQLKTVLGCGNADPTPEVLPFYRYPDVTVYAEDGKDFTAELKIVNIKTGEVISNTANQFTYFDEDALADLPTTVELKKDTQYPSAKGTSVVYKLSFSQKSFYLKNVDYRLGIFVKGANGQVIKMIEDCRSNEEPHFFVPATLEGKGYTKGTSEMALNSTVCDDAIISVGSYVSRSSWKYYKAPSDDMGLLGNKKNGERPQEGEVSEFSSYCIADDNGKARPTVLGPGQIVMSGYNNYEFGLLVDGAPSQSKYVALAPESQQVNKFGRMNWYGSMSGTSMSTPHVAGIITLWMQAKPTLTVNEILQALRQTCDKDSWTTDVSKIPSGHIEQAGLGKINALNGLKHLLGMPTGILEIDRQADTQKAAWFTLDGRRISATPTAKGIYIHQGRKVVVK